jgi:hypothetical protein
VCCREAAPVHSDPADGRFASFVDPSHSCKTLLILQNLQDKFAAAVHLEVTQGQSSSKDHFPATNPS